MKSPLQDYFDFSRKEQVGLMMLVGIILTCIIILNFHDVLFPKEVYDVSEKEKELIAAIETEREAKEESYSAERTDRRKTKAKKTIPEPFNFDPNSLDEAGYVRLGFSEKQAKSIRNYLSKGGRIWKVEDFKKLYVVNDYMYDRLKGYIQIKEEEKKERFADRPKTYESSGESKRIDKEEVEPRPPKALVDINAANNQELMAVRGIGPKYAERIIKYRDLLGGYTSLDQLGEVYGIKDHPEIVADLKTQMIVGTFEIALININSCEWVDLVRNPYIEKEIANSILAIRKTHGDYSSVADIKRSHLIDEALYEKISPYLTVDSR